MVDFYHAVNELEKWEDGKAVILHGAGDCFCSGGDLDVFRLIAENGRTTEMSFFMTFAMKKLTNLPLVSVAFISGRGKSSPIFLKAYLKYFNIYRITYNFSYCWYGKNCDHMKFKVFSGNVLSSPDSEKVGFRKLCLYVKNILNTYLIIYIYNI